MTPISTARALINARVMLRDGLHDGLAVVIDGARIAALVPAGDLPAALPRVDCAGQRLLPGFIDVQVNGGGGVLFNDAPNVETIAAIGAAHRRFGTTGFLPTLISDDLGTIARALAATRAAIAAGVPGVLGIHVEGPFISMERRGIHDPARLRTLDAEALTLLTAPGAGKVLLTLAPELVDDAIIRSLAAAGVIVSAGHTNAGFARMQAALDAGVTGITHLFNAMSPLTSREPGVVGAALAGDPWCGIIVDGRHVDPVTLRIALAARANARFMLVTDAMPCVGQAATTFDLQGKTITVRDGACYDDEGRLAGSNLDMAGALRNAVDLLGLDLATASALASGEPADFLGLGGERGRIAVGARADLVLLDAGLQVVESWIDGAGTGAVDHGG
ncbi:N-acetylglucosamine-6-phosphate deacetylase [Novosphingobium sp. FSW06-99]|uniref:N-acetylglucosamine-6-phosphate deacetylase n=1 Tax=Novosphingobium sp. FSW06-99 TaxID=1739113 RepID=UPI00076CC160|nr:N-acetylglucosamine-6-phosphate deacetylase [Novosphingobium sp. FSW06-99]KUR72090.1 N-acetylglucosamine-6-phosphate deacetylase [Novosphingobium sp. FSW06-99]